MKTKMTAVVMPGLICGSITRAESADVGGAKIPGRAHLSPVEPLERRVQRQRREREVEIHQHEDHGWPVIEEPARRVQPENAQQLESAPSLPRMIVHEVTRSR